VTITFVGRAHELAVLADVRARAAEGRRQLVAVVGAAGVGKTWFCERASAIARHDGFEVVWGRCWPYGGAPALWPWPAMLPTLAGEAGRRLLATDSESSQVHPERFTRFAALAELITESRSHVPTMVVIDDAHYADESALLLTRFLADTLDRLPLVLVLVRRPSPPTAGESAEAMLGALQRDAVTVPLRPFDLDDTAALLAAHGAPDPDLAEATALLRVTGGSPLHLTRAVERGWTDSSPATLEHAVADAIDRLSPPHRQVLSIAALLGPDGSISEVAGVAETAWAAVLEALSAAADGGLVELTTDRYRLHDVVRQVAASLLDPTETLDAHARAAAVLSETGQVERVAHHALPAAVRSAADADIAIDACRAAARALRRGYAYEPAADLLGRAVTLAEHQPDLIERAELQIERAEAVLACGRLIDARAAFEAAAKVAEQTSDSVLVARAMLGLGGVWVHEHRNSAIRHDVLARQRAALDALPAGERVLRCRLTVRLAAEAVYEGESVDTVLDALAMARALDDPGALAEALSLTHHALLAPDHAEMRLSLADEQIVAASAAGDGIRALFGLLWRTVDLYLLGDPDAERALAELRQRSTALRVATVDYIVACIDVMRLIRAGRLDEAEAAAEPCLRRGLEVGDADATGFYGAQLLAIRWLQGRDAELSELVSDTLSSASLAVVEYGFRASAVMVLARGGRPAEARAALKPLRESGLATLPRSSTWLAAMVGLVEAAWLLDDRALAAELADLLRPFAHLPVMASLAVSCFGSVARALGRAALTTGDPVSAIAYLEQAVAANERLDHRPATAVSRAALAEALTGRAGPGDLKRARSLLVEATTQAREMGLDRRAETWSAQLAALEPNVPAVLRRRGRDGWTVTGRGTHIDLPDLVGLHYLSRLLEHPGRELAATELCGAVEASARHELDDTTIADHRHRFRDLQAAIDDAEADADLGKAEHLRLERDMVASALTDALGLNHQASRFSASPERARTAVRKAIKRALDAIADQDPVLGGDLRGTVSTGTTCRYTPGDLRWLVERE
jgi:tetratricopeptide (TPR) repeat protein